MTDSVLAFMKLKNGGIMIFDDYGWKGYEDETLNPMLGIDSFLKCFNCQYQLLFSSYQIGIKNMKIAIACSLYLNNDTIKEWMEKSFSSIKTKHEFYFIVPKRVVTPEYEPIKYNLGSTPVSIIELTEYYPNGLSRGLNIAYKIAEGLGVDYVITTQHDIVFKSDAIDNLVEFAEKNLDCQFFSFTQHDDLETLETIENDENVYPSIYSPAVMFRPNFMREMNYLDENFYPVYYEDFDFTIRMLKKELNFYNLVELNYSIKMLRLLFLKKFILIMTQLLILVLIIIKESGVQILLIIYLNIRLMTQIKIVIFGNLKRLTSCHY